jgi:signal recognition particle receptor subunit beta
VEIDEAPHAPDVARVVARLESRFDRLLQDALTPRGRPLLSSPPPPERARRKPKGSMASLNPLTREVVFKVVFYGPGLGGKTTTLQYVHAATKPEHRGKMVSLATPMDRTLYFDFLPLRIPRVRGMSVRLQLFTVPGQVYYAATRKLVLTGADGVVFVADSQSGREDANQESLEDLVTNLAEHNRALASLPHTFHWNKRDLSDIVPLDELDRKFNPQGAPSLGTVATRGAGVFEGLERITRMVLRAYEAELPRGEIGAPFSTATESEEATIADAIRGLAESPYKPRVTPFVGMRSVKPDGVPSSLESIPAPIPRRQPSSPDFSDIARTVPPSPGVPQASGDGAVPVVPGHSAVPPAGSRLEDRIPLDPASVNDVAGALAPAPPPARELAAEAPPDVQSEHPLAPPEELARTAPSHTFSFSPLWSEAEREVAKEVERAISEGDGVGATVACDLLMTRILASAAGLAGTADAPRDPGVVSLLLGLEGRRYLSFRALVRSARVGEGVLLTDALDAYAFAIEARRAREALNRH